MFFSWGWVIKKFPFFFSFCRFYVSYVAAASPLLKTLVFILKERSSVVGLEEPWTSERFQEIANVVCISSVKVQELVGMCLESLKSGKRSIQLVLQSVITFCFVF